MYKVIVIDDEPLICSIVESYLKKIATVHKFSTAQEALSNLEKINPDVIISDFYMPEMSGLEMVSKLRINKNTTPVILMSGSHVKVDEISQFTAFIKKPMAPKDIQDLVIKLSKKANDMNN